MFHEPLIEIGESGIYLYGICMALGIICCFWYLLSEMERLNCNEESINKLLLFGICATAFGVFMAAVFQAIYNYIDDPSSGFSLNGLTFYGGLIGGVVGFVVIYNFYLHVVAKHTKIELLKNNMNCSVSDGLTFIPIAIGIAHAFGRLGCTFAGCCHGSTTTEWYGLYMYASSLGKYATVVPTQLFECLFIIALVIIMAQLYYKWKFDYNMGLYCIAYGTFRFLIEFVRDDDRGSFVAGLTPSQFWAIVMIAIGISYFFIHKNFFSKFQKHPEKQPPVREKVEYTPTIVFGKFDILTLVLSGIMLISLIASVIGVFVTFVGNSVYSYTLFNSTLASYDRYPQMKAFAFIVIAFIILVFLCYFMRHFAKFVCGKKVLNIVNSKVVWYITCAISIILVVCSIIALMLSNTLISNLYPAVGAYLIVCSGLVTGLSSLYTTIKKI